jgi:inhibitor of KinA
MKIAALGDAAVLVRLGESPDAATVANVQALAAALETDPLPGFMECVAANATVTVHYDPVRIPRPEGASAHDRVCQWVRERAAATVRRVREVVERRVEIPVCYGGDEGPDLDSVAAAHGLKAEEVVALHSSVEYFVSAVGFAPGFPYLGGLPPQLHTPRRATPRTRVPAGSVGIGGAQTGVYPFETPGGWHLVGRTPLRLFNPQARPPSMLQVGDRVRFRAITLEEFQAALLP